ncbi:MAG: molybdopterin-dependent oxidoreductase [Acidobacteriota bacterium]
MAANFTRREFIKITGFGTAGAITAGSLISKSEKAPESPVEKGIKKTPTYCAMCTFKCAGWAYTKDDKPWKLTGNKDDHHSNGRLCTKGSAGWGTYTDPDRLQTPLIRTGKRGEQYFREATWDEAFEYIAKKLKKIAEDHGPECVALLTHGSDGSFFKQLLKAYGSTNIAAPSYGSCRGPREEAYILTYGEPINSPERTDMSNSKCLVLLGTHIGENTHSSQVKEFGDSISNGASIITVDPRFSVAASKSDYWLPIKPGTDMALLLAWINVLIEEEIYDKKFVKKNTTGFKELKKHISKYTPEWAYTETTIKPEIIRETARIMAKNAPATLVHPGRMVVWYGDDTQRVRAGAILNALLGNWGKKGGFFNPVKASVPNYPHLPYPKPSKTWKDAFPGKYELANLALSSGICYATVPSVDKSCSFKGWIVYGTNAMRTMPDRTKTLEAIQNLDLLVAIDILPMEITGWADVILPECSYLERYGELRVTSGKKAQIALRMPAKKPLYNSKPSWWIAKELAKKMGLEKYFPWKNIEEYLDVRLKKGGTSLEELKSKGVVTKRSETPIYFDKNEEIEFDTESGKIELYSQTLEEHGFSPIPVYKKHEEPEEGYFRLLVGRSPIHAFGRTTNNPVLSQLKNENHVWINTNIAEEWGINNGQYIKLENQDGVISNRIRVKVTERIRPDSVYMVHGFGHTSKRLRKAYLKGADDSSLITRVHTDEIMGGTGMRGNFVTFVI